MGVLLSQAGLKPFQAPTLAVFVAAAWLLVAHIWSLNDWADSQVDSLNEHKRADTFGSKGISSRAMLLFSLALLGASLALFAFLPLRVLAIATILGLCGMIYSLSEFGLKGAPVLSSALHLCGGVLHFFLGYCLFVRIDSRAILLAPFFALVFTAGHATQEVQDWEYDRLHGIRTNAVEFGPSSVFTAAGILFGVAYLYLAVLACAAVVPIQLSIGAAAALGLHVFWWMRTKRRGLVAQTLRRLRGRYRLLFGAIGLGWLTLLWVS